MSRLADASGKRLALFGGLKILKFSLSLLLVAIPILGIVLQAFATHSTAVLERQQRELSSIGREAGIPALIEEIARREVQENVGRDKDKFLTFLLHDKDRRLLAGHPPPWLGSLYPGVAQDRPSTPDVLEAEEFVSASVIFPAGEQLFIAQPLDLTDHLLDDLSPVIIVATMLISVGSMAAALYLSSLIYQRIVILNKATEEFKRGRHYTRVELSGSGDEFDELASNLNDMFSRTEQHVKTLQSMGVNIAHDLRSHLTRIKTKLEVTVLSETGQADCREVLAETAENFGTLIDLFDSMLFISRIESGSGIEMQESVDIVKDMTTLLTLYSGSEREVLLKAETEVGPLDCNREILLRAVSNLIDNSLKFASLPGPIEVVIERAQGRIQVFVRDPGPGIPEEEVEGFSFVSRDRTVRAQLPVTAWG